MVCCGEKLIIQTILERILSIIIPEKCCGKGRKRVLKMWDTGGFLQRTDLFSRKVNFKMEKNMVNGVTTTPTGRSLQKENTKMISLLVSGSIFLRTEKQVPPVNTWEG